MVTAISSMWIKLIVCSCLEIRPCSMGLAVEEGW
jgi:hypothetical protein